MGSRWRSEALTVSGHVVRLRIRITQPDAPTIIGLHGFTGSSRDFEPLVQALGNQPISWILPDLMGHGESDAPANIDPYRLVCVLKLIDNCRSLVSPDSRPHLLGYSMGGRIALQYLARARPLPTLIIGGSPGIQEALARKERRRRDRRWADLLNQSMDAFCDQWEAQPLIHTQCTIPEPTRSQVASRRRAASPVGLANTLLALGTGTLSSLWESLPRMPPVSCLYGEKDDKFAAIAGRMKALNTHFEAAAIPGAGHAAHLENPEGVAESLVSWIHTG